MEPMSEDERQRTEMRLEIVEGLIRAHGCGSDRVREIDACANRTDARRRLTEPPFEFDEIVADHILDSPLGPRTRLSVRALEEEAAQLREQLDR